jgi:hypothetical protein
VRSEFCVALTSAPFFLGAAMFQLATFDAAGYGWSAGRFHVKTMSDHYHFRFFAQNILLAT